MTDKKREPEIDLLFKHAKNFVIKKLDELADFAVDSVVSETPKSAPPASTPTSVKTRIDKALAAHTSSIESSLIVCKCGERNNNLAYRTHLRDEIITALSAPDPATDWWQTVVDKP